jgi:GNAT superfamily N-acetyltransferase
MNITYINNISVEDFNILHEAVGWGACKPEKINTALERSDFIVAAQIENQIIGMARVIQDGLQALVMDVIVLPEYQSRGIGKELMSHVMEYLDSLSQDSGIFVNLMSAQGREGFYEQFGFECRPNEKRGSGMTKWIEKKEDTP